MKLVREVKVWLVGAPVTGATWWLGDVVIRGAFKLPEPLGFLSFLSGGILMTIALAMAFGVVGTTLAMLWQRYALGKKAQQFAEWVGRDDE